MEEVARSGAATVGAVRLRVAVLLAAGLEDLDAGHRIPVVVDWLERLSRQHELAVFTLRRSGEPGERRVGDAAVRYLAGPSSAPAWRQLLVYASALARAHAERPFDVIHAVWAVPTGPPALLAGALLRRPVVVSLQGADTADLPELGYGALTRRLPRWAVRAVVARADAVTCLSEYQRDLVRPFRRRPFAIVPYGVDTEAFAPMEAGTPPTPGELDDRPVRLLNVANQNPVKDQATLLRAVARVASRRPVELRIAGGDFMDGAVPRLADELGLGERVRCLGWLPRNELGAHLAWADCLVQSSVYESQGVAVVEGAAAGLAICGTRVGILADLAVRRAAVAVEVGDDDALANALLRLAADAGRREGLGRRARAWAESHSIDWTVERFSRLYRSLRAGEIS